jgi:hypothetical protein
MEAEEARIDFPFPVSSMLSTRGSGFLQTSSIALFVGYGWRCDTIRGTRRKAGRYESLICRKFIGPLKMMYTSAEPVRAHG